MQLQNKQIFIFDNHYENTSLLISLSSNNETIQSKQVSW
jgi:hypothetical protein